MIGLGSVKAEVHRQSAVIQAQMLRVKAGLKNASTPSRHMVFAGNPGTGKTTVARLIAKLYRALGVIATDKCVEVERGKLVGGGILGRLR
jgi:Holliday junction resolvasome RuvABC ATP-dependent DNA helicase subunit